MKEIWEKFRSWSYKAVNLENPYEKKKKLRIKKWIFIKRAEVQNFLRWKTYFEYAVPQKVGNVSTLCSLNIRVYVCTIAYLLYFYNTSANDKKNIASSHID